MMKNGIENDIRRAITDIVSILCRYKSLIITALDENPMLAITKIKMPIKNCEEADFLEISILKFKITKFKFSDRERFLFMKLKIAAFER